MHPFLFFGWTGPVQKPKPKEMLPFIPAGLRSHHNYFYIFFFLLVHSSYPITHASNDAFNTPIFTIDKIFLGYGISGKLLIFLAESMHWEQVPIL